MNLCLEDGTAASVCPFLWLKRAEPSQDLGYKQVDLGTLVLKSKKKTGPANVFLRYEVADWWAVLAMGTPGL